MLLIIISGLVFLVGVSTFVAVLGTSFLKRCAERSDSVLDLRSSESEYAGRYREEYTERIGEEKEAVEREAMTPQLPPPSVRPPAGSVWRPVSVTAGVVIVVALILLYGMGVFRQKDPEPRLYFCENVNFEKYRPIRRSRMFTRGNVTLLVKSKSALDLGEASIEVYRLSEAGFDPYTSKNVHLKPQWYGFSSKVVFDRVGSYMVSVIGDDGRLLCQENIRIVPDSFAYKPVPAPPSS